MPTSLSYGTLGPQQRPPLLHWNLGCQLPQSPPLKLPWRHTPAPSCSTFQASPPLPHPSQGVFLLSLSSPIGPVTPSAGRSCLSPLPEKIILALVKDVKVER